MPSSHGLAIPVQPSYGIPEDERFSLLFRREHYIKRLNLVAQSPFGRERNPQRTLNSFFVGFFIKVSILAPQGSRSERVRNIRFS